MFLTEYHACKIEGVYSIKRKAGSMRCTPRDWGAVAFRMYGESVFETQLQTINADAGSILYIPAGLEFFRESTAEELIIIHIKCYEEKDSMLEVAHSHNTAVIRTLFCDVHRIWQEKAPGYEQQAGALLYTILAKLQENKSFLQPSYKQMLIQPGVELMDTGFEDPDLSTRQLAERCNISEEYFRKLYKEIYGRSPRKAITDKRIQNACRMLSAGYFSVEEVTKQCGFQNSKYFSTLFHKIMKMSPSEYKRRYSR